MKKTEMSTSLNLNQMRKFTMRYNMTLKLYNYGAFLLSTRTISENIQYYLYCTDIMNFTDIKLKTY